MAELIGVINSIHALRPPFLKRTALLFDRIALPEAGNTPIDKWSETHPDECNELLWLIDKGIVFEARVTKADMLSVTAEDEAELKISGKEMAEAFEKILEGAPFTSTPSETIIARIKEQLTNPGLDSNSKLKLVGHFLQVGEHLSRIFGCLLRGRGMRAYPVLSTSLQKQSNASPSDVIEIVFNNFPTPSEDTPWELILDYRADPDSRAKFFALRNWINETIRANLSPIEIEEKLEHLLTEYKRHLELHKMKTNTGTIETVVMSGLQITENLAKLKLKELGNVLFAAKHRKLALYEGELTAPGHELAYILKTQDTFL